MTAEADFTVVEPTPHTITLTYGTINTFPVTIFSRQYLMLGGPPPGGAAGIHVEGTADAPEHFGGEFAFIQRINTVRRYTDQHGANFIATTGDNIYTLDRKHGAQEIFISGPPVAVAAGETSAPIQFDDTPNMYVPSNYQQMSINDNFEVFLMFKPEGGDSIWVPIRKFRWGWDTGAVNNSPWVLSPANPAPDVPQQGATTQFPEWAARIQDLIAQPGWWQSQS